MLGTFQIDIVNVVGGGMTVAVREGPAVPVPAALPICATTEITGACIVYESHVEFRFWCEEVQVGLVDVQQQLGG